MASDAAHSQPAALAGLRVLDLSGPLGQYCGKMFADMGADVILIEPPQGAATRREPPFIDDEPGVERSLSFAYFNTSKRGVTLDLDCAQGQALFRRLAATADLVLETEKPGVMARRGLTHAELTALRPMLVMTSITPFGQTGPYANYEAEDLVALAMGGLLYLGGYPDIAPSRVYGNQACLGASMFGAVASMLALPEAEASGEGQHVDVSMQECVVMALETAVQYYDLEGTIRKRYAGQQRFAGTGVFPCKDGYVYMMAGGIGANKFWALSVQWLLDEKLPGVERLHGEQWTRVDYLLTGEAKRIFAEVFAPFALTRTKAELYHEGQRRRIPLAPINTPADMLASPQLRHRGYFIEVAHALRGRPLLMPGAPYRLSRTPWRVGRPAPQLGEHNAEVLGEIGVVRDELESLRSRGVI
ncbi:MAG: CoA transferase [Betaproteobacteria bacterium]|nr:CoA transferase [Betaproteobacteria bacterium]